VTQLVKFDRKEMVFPFSVYFLTSSFRFLGRSGVASSRDALREAVLRQSILSYRGLLVTLTLTCRFGEISVLQLLRFRVCGR
jgi:hypothetical protein